MTQSIQALENKRRRLLEQLAAAGDMRRGSITEQYRCCGKTPCCCKESDHPGHGPYYAFTRKVGGKTKTRQLRPGPQLRKLEREVETSRQFRALTEQLLQVNEALCDLRPVVADSEAVAGQDAKKNFSRRSRKRPTAS